MGKRFERTPMILRLCTMLLWPFGITPNQQMITQVTTSTKLENIHGAVSRGIKQKAPQRYEHHLPAAVANIILPSFEALSDVDLL